MAHQLTNNTTALEELLAKAEALPAEKKVQASKSVTPGTITQIVRPDNGYDGLASVTVNAMPTGSVGTPSITVSDSGLITATTAVDAGYVNGDDKSGTKQLTTKAAATITPGTSNQTIAAGTYLTGTQTIAGDADLVPKNILKGVNIFGVTGTVVKMPALPAFTYTGTYDTETDNNDNWKIRFLSSGTLTLTEQRLVDMFAVGGGGAGGNDNNGTTQGDISGGGGGAGGFTTTKKGVTMAAGSYTITVGGSGGTSKIVSGSTTMISAAGGGTGSSALMRNAPGGSGGSGGGTGVSWNGNSGISPGKAPGYNGSNGGGTGQGTTTREFGEASGTLYAGGGSGGVGMGNSVSSDEYYVGASGGGGTGAHNGTVATPGQENTGGGGGGGGGQEYSFSAISGYSKGAAGGSGIVIIRNKR